MTAFPFRSAHFIGLAGVGMSATAILLRDSGVAVTGSDEAIYPPISHVLAQENFAYRTPYAPENIPEDADLIVLDIMLPKRNGFSVCQDLRNAGVHTPLLMLTAPPPRASVTSHLSVPPLTLVGPE